MMHQQLWNLWYLDRQQRWNNLEPKFHNWKFPITYKHEIARYPNAVQVSNNAPLSNQITVVAF